MQAAALDLLATAPIPLEGVAAVKAAAHWIVTGLPLNLSIGCFLSFCRQRVFMKFKKPTGDSFESWIVNHFGKKMYDIYFGPYTEKVWGVPPSTLAAFCAEQRVAVQSLFLVLLSTIFKNIKLKHRRFKNRCIWFKINTRTSLIRITHDLQWVFHFPTFKSNNMNMTILRYLYFSPIAESIYY